MNFFREITEKPWLVPEGGAADFEARHTSFQPAPKIALRMFLAVVGVIFFLLIISYGARMVSEDWRPGPRQNLLWLNTAWLILSSVSLQWAVISARRDDLYHVKWGLIGGGAFAIAFLAGQVVTWWQLDLMPLFNITNPAISFFYMITGMHALHIIGGLVAWGKTMLGIADDESRVGEQLLLRTELCATYWHYLLGVWLILFFLLFSGNDNLGLFLTICGLK